MRIARVLLFLVIFNSFPTNLVAQAEGMRYSITVAEFENRSNEPHSRKLGSAWSDIMTSLLTESGHFIVVGSSVMREDALDEQDLAVSGFTVQGGKSPVSGQMTSAQLLLYGTITYVEMNKGKQGAGINLGGIQLGGNKQKVEIGITVSLLDSTTGQVVASANVKGLSESRSGGVRFRTGGADINVSGEKNDNLVDALADAGEQAIDWLIGQLTHVRWSGKVLTVADSTVVVDRGEREGVRTGQVFEVGKAEILRSPDTGEILDERLEQIAEIQVVEVRAKVSYCKVLSGDAKAVRKGLTVHLR